MIKDYKGYGCSVSVNGDDLFIKQLFIKEDCSIENIESIDWNEPTMRTNGAIKLQTKNNYFQLNFTKKKQDEFKELYDYLCSRLSIIKDVDLDEIDSKKLGTLSSLEYKGGHPLIVKEGKVDIDLYENKLVIAYSLNRIEASFRNILNVHYETQEQIEKRITATRLITLGVFALAFKKKKKNTDKYLTIDFKDDNGLEYTALFTGTTSNIAYSSIYNALSTYKSTHNENIIEDTSTQNETNDPYEELKKLKELLDMGIISQEDFEAKKKDLLQI